MIAIQNISFGYRGHRVFDNFSMEFHGGKIYGLLGLNGSGKSTLLYLISGLLFPDKGSISIGGAALRNRKPVPMSQLYMVPEEFGFPNVTFDRYVKLYAPFYPRFSSETFNKCLDGFGVDTSQRLSRLSMGQKKKALMSFALAANTKCLLMDEPTNGLDIPSKSQFRKVVSSCMDDDRLIIVSTHQVKDVENLIDQVSIIGWQGLVFNQEVPEIAKRLAFGLEPAGQPDGGALFSLPSIGGNAVVRPALPGGKETPLDVEMLFNAVLDDPAKINSVFPKR